MAGVQCWRALIGVAMAITMVGRYRFRKIVSIAIREHWKWRISTVVKIGSNSQLARADWKERHLVARLQRHSPFMLGKAKLAAGPFKIWEFSPLVCCRHLHSTTPTVEPVVSQHEQSETHESKPVNPKPKKPRGRPRKHPLPDPDSVPVKRPRGRPQKHSSTEQECQQKCGAFDFPFEGKSTDTELVEAAYEKQDRDTSSPHPFTVERIQTPEGRFYHIHSQEESYNFPSVTNVLSSTRPPQSYFSLRNWRKNMIKEHGESGYRKIKEETMRTGSHFHRQLESKLLETKADLISIKPEGREQVEPPSSEQPSPAEIAESHVRPCTIHKCTDYSIICDTFPEEEDLKSSGFLKSVECVLEDISKVYALESVVSHMQLGYTGTCDCIASYRGELCVIDWKTSSKPRPSLSDCYDFPLQAVAYAGAINQDPHYPFKVHHALIVVAYPNGDPAHPHLLSLEQCLDYWHTWLSRLQQYHTRFAHDLSNVYV